MLRRSFLLAAGGLLGRSTASSSAPGDAWPQRSLRFLVGFPAGGGGDVAARKFQEPLARRLGRPVIVDNRPGAGGLTATTELARSDDHSLGLIISSHASLPAIQRRMPYDVGRDFACVAMIGTMPLILLVRPNSPYRTAADLLADARTRAGRLNYGMPGIGVPHHFAGEALKQQAGIDFATVTYRGTPPMLTDLAGEQIDFIFGTPSSVMGAVMGGLVRPLAVTAPGRLAALPDVPTTTEAGLPGFEANEWYGVAMPAVTPASVVARMNEAINGALAEPDLQEWLKVNGVTRGPTTPEGFAAFVADEIVKFTEIARKANITIE